MTIWVDKPYWIEADSYAKSVHRQLLNQLSQRAIYFHEEPYIPTLKYKNDISFSSGIVDFIFEIRSDENIREPDNLGYCLTSDEHCQIEIVSYLPRYYRIKKLLREEKYLSDLLNVIRHEVEHMFQSGAYEVDCVTLDTYNRSPNNYMLDAAEVPAYVHGFRIATGSNLEFCNVISEFIDAHGASLKLTDEEIHYTKKVWYTYLKNLDN